VAIVASVLLKVAETSFVRNYIGVQESPAFDYLTFVVIPSRWFFDARALILSDCEVDRHQFC